MRNIHIATLVLALSAIIGCEIDNIDCPSLSSQGYDEITIIGRTTRFDDYNVETRAAKQGDEVKITSYAVAIFEVDTTSTPATVGECKYYNYDANASQILLTISRQDENNNLLYDENARYAIYVFANMPGMSAFSEANTLKEMLAVSWEVQNLRIPENNGFPMIGSLGDNFSTEIDQDGKKFIMYSSRQENPPIVDGEAISTLNIPMRALFAKINFEIEVRPDQMIQGSDYPPQFSLSSCTVKCIPSSVDFDNSTDADTVFDTQLTNITGNRTASGANKISFSFYLPENLLEPAIKAEDYPYPFKKDGKIREEDEKYRQRYKGKLLGDNQHATNIVLSGEFRDHQSHSVEVDYTIHLGEDNYSDFNIKRNGEYNNYITIKGILNSNDERHEGTDNYISLDHRVNVKYTEPAIISLRRELLLDSHFEIRPLRIRKNTNLTDEDVPTHVRIAVTDAETAKWLRLERSFGDGMKDGSYPQNQNNEFIYIDSSPDNPSAIGKRRYFTHDLVTNTLAESGKEVIVPLMPVEDEDLCVWIYIDECTDVGDGIRSGAIRVTYGSYNGEKFTETSSEKYPPADYIMNQRLLYPVTYGEHEYHIEFYEEFLYNFDSDDSYGQTDQSGMKWGLDGIQLSHLYDAFYFLWDDDSFEFSNSLTPEEKGRILTNAVKELGYNSKYDYYLPRDTENSELKIRAFAGYDYNSEIISHLKANYSNNPAAKLERIALNEKPKSAIAYCYNRNKRDQNGNVVLDGDTGWYLPAIDEIEEIVKAEYASYFKEFQDNLYWSCQPSYIPYEMSFIRYRYWLFWTDMGGGEEIESEFYTDDTKNARATKVLSENGVFTGIPDSGADTYLRWDKGKIYISASNVEKNKTAEIGTEQIINSNYNDIKKHPGNLPRTDMARVRCVRKMQ